MIVLPDIHRRPCLRIRAPVHLTATLTRSGMTHLEAAYAMTHFRFPPDRKASLKIRTCATERLRFRSEMKEKPLIDERLKNGSKWSNNISLTNAVFMPIQIIQHLFDVFSFYSIRIFSKYLFHTSWCLTNRTDRGSFDRNSVDRNCVLSVDRNFHNQLTKIFDAFQLIEWLFPNLTWPNLT